MSEPCKNTIVMTDLDYISSTLTGRELVLEELRDNKVHKRVRLDLDDNAMVYLADKVRLAVNRRVASLTRTIERFKGACTHNEE